MSRIYDRRSFRNLPRVGECAGLLLFGGECDDGPLHLHHLRDDEEELLLLCATHHGILHGAQRRSEGHRGWRRCAPTLTAPQKGVQLAKED